MELETQTMLSFGLGLLAGFLLFCLVALVFVRQARARFQAEAADLELTIADLRQELVDDRETNRRLRHELAVSTPEHLEATRLERDEAQAQVAALQEQLDQAGDQLAERDRSLREARLAIQDIRRLLEAGDGAAVERLNQANGTGEPPNGTGEPANGTGEPADGTGEPDDGTGEPGDGTNPVDRPTTPAELAGSMDEELAEMTADERVGDG